MAGKFQPQTTWQRWTAGEFLFEILLAACALVLGIGAGVKILESDNYAHLGPWAIGASVLSFWVLVARAIKRNRLAIGIAQLHALDGALHTLHAILENGETRSGLRLCVFVRNPSKQDTVNQLTNYVGVESPYGRGRDLSSRCGVVGRAFRSAECVYDRLPNGVALIDHLVGEHGFDRGEAGQMKKDRRSWAAMPVGDPVVALIFLDTSDANFFGNKNSLRRKNLDAAAIGVAIFMAKA